MPCSIILGFVQWSWLNNKSESDISRISSFITLPDTVECVCNSGFE
jgi:hypothetical protein